MVTQNRGLRGFLSRNFRFSEWIGKEFLVQGYTNIKQLFYIILAKNHSARNESFAEAVVRLRLSETDIVKQKEYYRMTSVIYGSFLLFSVVYAMWLYWVDKNLLSAFMTVVYSVLMFAFFFRESFWYMQITKRRLGHTFGDWWCFMLGRH